jgi:hypothetical protein
VLVRCLPGPPPRVRKRPREKCLADGYPFHASALRDIDPVSRRGNGSSHIDPNMLRAPGSGSFLAKDPAKLVTGDAPATFYTNDMLT